MGLDGHGRDVVHAMRRDVALLVVVEPVQGEAPPWHEVYPPAGLVDGLRRYGGPVLQPVTQRRRGELALVAEGVVWCGVVWCGVVWCVGWGGVWCGVVWCGVPKALLPKGKGRDVYPRVQVNGLGCVCCVHAVCKCVVA